MGLPRTERQNDAILNFVDRLTKYVIIIPTKSTIDAEGTARLYLDHVFALHSLSKSVVSDRHLRFTSLFLQEVFSLLALLDIKFKKSTANQPQTDGLTERVNRIVEDTLRLFVNHRQANYDLLLPLCQFSVNSSFQASTGESPFFLNSGYHLITPSGLVDTGTRTTVDYAQNEHSPCSWLHQREEEMMIAKDALASAQARQAFYCDKGSEEVNLRVGDLVFIHREVLITPEARDRPSNELRPKWYGPFKITDKVSTNAFRLDLPFTFQLRCHHVFNVSALKKYYKNTIEER